MKVIAMIILFGFTFLFAWSHYVQSKKIQDDLDKMKDEHRKNLGLD